jgi:hypothetical protein
MESFKMSNITVLKFGSSVLRSESDLPLAVHEIYREWRAGRRVLAVVSAFGSATDDLLKRAQQLGLPPQREGLAALLATGESTSAALLTLALDRSGLPVTLLDPTQIGLVTQGDPLDADPVAVDAPYLARELERAVVVDVDGSDSAQKLSLLAREAFGEALPWQRISRRGIDGIDERAVAEAARRGRRVRLVASCERAADGPRASVQPLELPPDHPLARPRGAGNALAIELVSGETLNLEARGAGRWPTTEAVLADLYDLAAEAVQTAEEPVEQEGAA